MSVTIRLSRIGKKNSPSYRIVVSNTRSKREGENLDTIGFYNPSNTPALFELDKEKLNSWVSKGAKVTDAVTNLMEGKYTFTKYQPKKDAAKEE